MSYTEKQVRHVENLKWAISLLREDIKALSPGETQVLKEKIYKFTYGWAISGSAYPLKTPEEAYEEMGPEDLRDIQAAMRMILTRVASAERLRDPLLYLKRPPAQTPASNTLLINTDPSQPCSVMTATDNVVMDAQTMLGVHLASSGLPRNYIRMCPRCQVLFLLTRKPQINKNRYCSPKCATAVASQKWRVEHGEPLKAKEGKRNRHRYEEKTRRQPGKANVKIARRPRKAREN